MNKVIDKILDGADRLYDRAASNLKTLNNRFNPIVKMKRKAQYESNNKGRTKTLDGGCWIDSKGVMYNCFGDPIAVHINHVKKPETEDSPWIEE